MVGLVGGRDSNDAGGGTLLLSGELSVEVFDVAVQELDTLDRWPRQVVDALGTGGGLQIAHQGVAFGGQTGPAERCFKRGGGLPGGLHLERMSDRDWLGGAGVDGPDLAALGAPVPDQVLDRLARIVGHHMHVRGLAGSAHPDIAELPAAAIGEEMSDIHGGALRAVNRCRVTQGQPVATKVVGPEDLGAAVVHAGSQAPGGRVDGDDAAPFGGDGLAAGAGGEGDDPVAGLEGLPIDFQLRSGELPRRGHRLAGPGVDGSDVGPPPGVRGRVLPGGDICCPRVDHLVEGPVPVGGDPDPVGLGIPVDRGLDVTGP